MRILALIFTVAVTYLARDLHYTIIQLAVYLPLDKATSIKTSIYNHVPAQTLGT